ncbi:MAG: hypothetical protein NTX15_06010 [Candidatus Kapabacteria bacterium]|nr:hypothetical protein [Candidatus Kapabacteria bacterium]
MITEVLQTLPLVLYALYVSGRYLSATQARILQSLIAACFIALLIGTSLDYVSSLLLVVLQAGLSLGVIAMAVPMAFNAMRVRSGRLRGWIELIVTAIVVVLAFI